MKRTFHVQKQLRRVLEERGSALVEFAVTVPLLVSLLFGVLECMYAMYAYHYTAYAAQQGARFAMVRGSTASQNIATPCSTSAPPNFTMVYVCESASSDVQNYVRSLGAINPNRLTTSTTWPGQTPSGATAPCTGSNKVDSKGCLVKVTANYTFDFVPFLPFTGLTLHATSEKVILQ